MIEHPIQIEPARPLTVEIQSAPAPRQAFRQIHPLALIIGGVAALVAILAVFAGLIQKWLWLRQLGYAGVFWTILSMRWGLFGVAFVAALAYVLIHLRITARNGAALRAGKVESEADPAIDLAAQIPAPLLKLGLIAVAAGAALVFSLIFFGQWDTYLRFRYGGSFGLADPLYGIDTGFYVFRLPFYGLLQSSLTGLALMTLLGVLAFYASFGLLRLSRGERMAGPVVQVQMPSTNPLDAHR
jgi:hypothetical protein